MRDKEEIEALKYYLSQFGENDPDIAAFNLEPQIGTLVQIYASTKS